MAPKFSKLQIGGAKSIDDVIQKTSNYVGVDDLTKNNFNSILTEPQTQPAERSESNRSLLPELTFTTVQAEPDSDDETEEKENINENEPQLQGGMTFNPSLDPRLSAQRNTRGGPRVIHSEQNDGLRRRQPNQRERRRERRDRRDKRDRRDRRRKYDFEDEPYEGGGAIQQQRPQENNSWFGYIAAGALAIGLLLLGKQAPTTKEEYDNISNLL